MSRPVVESESVTVADGETETIASVPAGTTVNVTPGPGGTMTCQVRVAAGDEPEDIDPDTATYNAPTRFVLLGPVAELVFGATTAPGTGSITYSRRHP